MIQLIRKLIVVLLFVQEISALICYERKNHTLLANECAECKYCVYGEQSPAPNNHKPSMYGIGPESEDLEVYDAIFNQSNDMYNVLSVCVLEQYRNPAIPVMGAQAFDEFILRCFCKDNSCNMAVSLSKFLKLQREMFEIRD